MAFHCENLAVLGLLALFLLEVEHGSVDEVVERVFVEFAARHLAVGLLVLRVLEHSLEHVLLVAARHSFREVLFLLEASLLLFSVEFNLLFELFILVGVIALGLGFHLLDLSALLHHFSKASTALLSPELLMVFSLLEDDLFERGVGLELVRENFEALISYNAAVKLLYIFVCVHCFDDAHESVVAKVNVLEGDIVHRVLWVLNQSRADVDASFACEFVVG